MGWFVFLLTTLTGTRNVCPRFDSTDIKWQADLQTMHNYCTDMKCSVLASLIYVKSQWYENDASEDQRS